MTINAFQAKVDIREPSHQGISIDDFGIGYSSPSALADITADEIKIDRSFITDIQKRPRSQSILRAIESLSEALGMTMVASEARISLASRPAEPSRRPIRATSAIGADRDSKMMCAPGVKALRWSLTGQRDPARF